MASAKSDGSRQNESNCVFGSGQTCNLIRNFMRVLAIPRTCKVTLQAKDSFGIGLALVAPQFATGSQRVDFHASEVFLDGLSLAQVLLGRTEALGYALGGKQGLNIGTQLRLIFFHRPDIPATAGTITRERSRCANKASPEMILPRNSSIRSSCGAACISFSLRSTWI